VGRLAVPRLDLAVRHRPGRPGLPGARRRPARRRLHPLGLLRVAAVELRLMVHLDDDRASYDPPGPPVPWTRTTERIREQERLRIEVGARVAWAAVASPFEGWLGGEGAGGRGIDE